MESQVSSSVSPQPSMPYYITLEKQVYLAAQVCLPCVIAIKCRLFIADTFLNTIIL